MSQRLPLQTLPASKPWPRRVLGWVWQALLSHFKALREARERRLFRASMRHVPRHVLEDLGLEACVSAQRGPQEVRWELGPWR
jgi:hypothetical protein